MPLKRTELYVPDEVQVKLCCVGPTWLSGLGVEHRLWHEELVPNTRFVPCSWVTCQVECTPSALSSANTHTHLDTLIPIPAKLAGGCRACYAVCHVGVEAKIALPRAVVAVDGAVAGVDRVGRLVGARQTRRIHSASSSAPSEVEVLSRGARCCILVACRAGEGGRGGAIDHPEVVGVAGKGAVVDSGKGGEIIATCSNGVVKSHTVHERAHASIPEQASRHSPADVQVNVVFAPGAVHASEQTESRSGAPATTVQSVLYCPLVHADEEQEVHTFAWVKSRNPLLQKHVLMLGAPGLDPAFGWHSV